MRHLASIAVFAAFVVLAGFGTAASAQPAAAPAAVPAAPTLRLSAQATRSVALDEMVVVLASEQEGPAVGPLNRAVLEALSAALAAARAEAGVEAEFSGIHSFPVRVKDKPAGWRVRGELTLRSRRHEPLAALATRFGDTLLLSDVRFRLSREQAEQTQAALIDEAGRAFRLKAEQGARALGFKGWELQSAGIDLPPAMPPVPVMRAAVAGAMADGGEMAMAAPSAAGGRADAALLSAAFAAAGRTDVTVTINGVVTLRP